MSSTTIKNKTKQLETTSQEGISRSTVGFKSISSGAVRVLTSHPYNPYYLTGTQHGQIELWQYGLEDPVTSYQYNTEEKNKTRIQCIRFNSTGNKFGAGNKSGKINLWCFEDSETTLPYRTLECLNKVKDIYFLNRASLIGAAGKSQENKNICLCDTLLPDSKAIVQTFQIFDGGSSNLVFSSRNQILFACGKNDIAMIDIRQRIIIYTENHAHESSIKSLAIDPLEKFLVSGSSDGCIKIWDYTGSTLQLVEEWPEAHPRSRHSNLAKPLSTHGVKKLF